MIRRRRFLQGLGVAGLAAGIPGFGMRNVLAAEGEAPKRLIVISHCHGWPYDAWKMRPSGVVEGAPWEVSLNGLTADEFSVPMAPLYSARKRMLMLDGLSLATCELDMDGNRHDTGWVQAWTGNWADFGHSDTRSRSASLDQLVAAQINRPDRLPSFEISVDDQLEGGRPVAYAQNGIRLPVLNNPAQAWQRLFGPSLDPNPLMAKQKDILSFAHAEYSAMAQRLGSAQRQKLDAHYTLINSLKDRLEGMASLSCMSAPEPQSALPSYTERFDAFAELIGAALSCDVTRVVSLSLGEMPTADFGWDHLTDNVHKGIAHGIYDSPTKHQAMTDYLKMHAEQVARLVSVLESVPDVDGQTVMDNTLIVWGSELANGWHGYQHYCPVIIGGSWHFNTGRYLYWPHDVPINMLVPASVSASGYSEFSGKPHQHLLVSVAQAMGVQTEHVGLKHVQGQNGHWVDCSGPLGKLI